MERRVSYEIYAMAILLSAITFVIGIYLGNLVDQNSYQGISNELQNVSQKVESEQLNLLLENSSVFCSSRISSLKKIDNEIEIIGYKLTYLEQAKRSYDPELKRQYFAVEAQSYLLSQKAQANCNDHSVLLINFYSNTNCSSCASEGDDILRSRDDLSGQNISISLFSFDGELGSPVADAFKKEYSIKVYPSVIINGQTYSGHQTSNQLDAIIRSVQNVSNG